MNDNPTLGPVSWTGDKPNYTHEYNDWLCGPNEGILLHGAPWPVREPNKALIVEAFDVRTETGKSPRQLQAALSHRDKRVAELEGELVDAQVFAHYAKEKSDKLQAALTALREAVKTYESDPSEECYRHMLSLANQTTGDTDHAHR